MKKQQSRVRGKQPPARSASRRNPPSNMVRPNIQETRVASDLAGDDIGSEHVFDEMGRMKSPVRRR
jgi:hypothetical protein